MDEQNPYRSPEAQVMSLPGDDETMAGRGARLVASFIDCVIAIAAFLPLMYVGGYFTAVFEAIEQKQQVGFGFTLLWALIGIAVIVVIQGYPLHATGQTWGKRALGIKIVDLAGKKPSLTHLLARRILPISLVGSIPFAGGLLTLVDVLLIFRSDRRCGHDLIAGTKVVPVD